MVVPRLFTPLYLACREAGMGGKLPRWQGNSPAYFGKWHVKALGWLPVWGLQTLASGSGFSALYKLVFYKKTAYSLDWSQGSLHCQSPWNRALLLKGEIELITRGSGLSVRLCSGKSLWIWNRRRLVKDYRPSKTDDGQTCHRSGSVKSFSSFACVWVTETKNIFFQTHFYPPII